MALARGKLACFATTRERQPAQWRSCVGHAKAGCALLEVTFRTPHHDPVRKERGFPPVHCPSMSRRPITASAARRARGKLACFATSRETTSAVALIRVQCERRLGVRGHSSHVAPRSCAETERLFAGAVPFHIAYTEYNQRGTALACCKLECFATSRETASAVALVRVPCECRPSVGGHSSIRHTTVLHQRRQASCRCSALP